MSYNNVAEESVSLRDKENKTIKTQKVESDESAEAVHIVKTGVQIEEFVEVKEDKETAAAVQILKDEDTIVKVVVGAEGDQLAAADHSSYTMASFSKSNEPPAFISERKSYAEYKSDLSMWSRITAVPKKNQAEVIVYNLDGHPSRIKEKIVLNIGDQIQDADDGVTKLIEFLDTIYKVDDMADAWSKYKNFQKIARTEIEMINDFIAEFEKEYMLAKSAGCEYNDIILGFRLLEATKLSETKM